MEAEDGNQKGAMALFETETKLFPESKKYAELAIIEMGAK